ncbi:hypothetical protein LCGC14_0803900 [marine sediment metagenome]|uniref:Uncharacterized protein n=1 Tax=marine sediment metagenome TaxID=412755 RepID=A0A0F9SW30_9ZZZZ
MNEKESTPQTRIGSRERLKKLMEEESRTVKGVFRFHECPGGVTTIPMKKYPGQQRVDYVFKDGEDYTVPLWVARWLNGYDACAQALNGKINSCGYPIHENTVDRVSGKPHTQVGSYRRRMAFESTEFMSV